MKIYNKPQICVTHICAADSMLAETSMPIKEGAVPGGSALAKPGNSKWEEWDDFDDMDQEDEQKKASK